VRKNFGPSDDPRLEENSLPQPPTYVRNIQTGKSKKKSLCPGKLAAGEKSLAYRPPTDIRNIAKGKEEKKSWYQYVFF
jgi:hypothetical protein